MPRRSMINFWAMLILTTILTIIFNFGAEKLLAREPKVHSPLQLRVWPEHISVSSHHPINLHVALENITGKDVPVRIWFTPVPFGPASDLHCFFMRCYDLKTSKEVAYTGFPPGATTADGRRTEPSFTVPQKCFVGATFDLRQFCNLTPGDYKLILKYDTRFVPNWIRPDKEAWHGVTNEVTVKIHIS